MQVFFLLNNMEPATDLSPGHFWMITANSTAAFVMAYLIVFYISFFTNIFTCGMFGFDISFDYNQIVYHIEPYQWTHDSVKLIYSAGPLLVFFTGLISLIGFFGLTEEQSRLKILFVWITLLAFNQTFGNLMIGNLFKQGVGHVFNWMYFTDTQKMIVALVGFFGLLTTAFIMASPVAVSANSYFNKLGERNFPFFISSQIILPFIFGYLLIVGYFSQRMLFQEKFSWISLIVLIVIIFINLNNADTKYFDEDDRKPGYSKFLIIGAIIMFVGLRIILSRSYTINW